MKHLHQLQKQLPVYHLITKIIRLINHRYPQHKLGATGTLQQELPLLIINPLYPQHKLGATGTLQQEYQLLIINHRYPPPKFKSIELLQQTSVILNKPPIPTEQVQIDWNTSSNILVTCITDEDRFLPSIMSHELIPN